MIYIKGENRNKNKYLLLKDARFRTKVCQDSFKTTLHYADFIKQFIITVDISDFAAGAVRSQEFEGNDLSISYTR